jgi:GMP synthase-like glutamine amidotransferase
MKRAVVLQHAEFEGPAAIAEIVVQEGYSLDVRALHRGDPVPRDLGRDDLLVVMGGSMGVADLDRPEYSYLPAEVELLERRIREDAPSLGVCLGAQLLAHAAGAAVYPMRSEDSNRRVYEVGWAPITFHGTKNEGVLAGLPSEAPVLHWHGDTFDLPANARLLASSARCRHQGFQLGRRLFGLQFHCELAAGDIEVFLREDAEYVRQANGAAGIEQLRQDTVRYVDSFRSLGDRLLQNILRAMIAP